MARTAHSIAQLRLLARQRLPRPVFDFADGGAEDEITLRANEAAFEQASLWPQPLQSSPSRELSLTLFGRRLGLPVLIGPTGLAGLFWPQGEQAAARAAAQAQTVYCLSHGSVCNLEALAQASSGPKWMQVFIYKDRGFTRELTQRAQAAGYEALVLTIDNQLLGKRERDLFNGFSIPPRFGPRQLAQFAVRAPWWWAMRRELPRITFGNYLRPGKPESAATLAGRMGSLLDPGMGWDDVAALRAQWRGPLLLKGVLHPLEALRAIDCGVDGLIVSNHGGRQLDGAVASLRALPAVVQAVEGRIPVLVDGGVRRGRHVLAALALGAKAVLVGRPQLWGLAVGGENGVALALEILRSELDRAMGLCGLRSVQELLSQPSLARSLLHPGSLGSGPIGETMVREAAPQP